jgi:L1 cell adhesion molecule like protein
LGTSYSCVSVWHNDRAEIIANDYGYRITPSYVAFTNSEILIGDAAKNQISLNPHNTVFDICRLIGRSFHNLEVQSVMKACSIQKKKNINSVLIFKFLNLKSIVKLFFIQILLY